MNDESLPSEPGPESPRLRSSVRIGLVRASNGAARSLASLILARDGGVMIAPAAVPNDDWRYGIIRDSGPLADDLVTTPERPKLHYHQSGIVSVSLTGTPLPPRRLPLPALGTRLGDQILSVICESPWALPAVTHRNGDANVIVPKWPERAWFTVSVLTDAEYDALEDLGTDPVRIQHMGDWSRSVVSLSGYGHKATLAVAIGSEESPDDAPLAPSITVAALPGKANDPTTAFALFSASLRNPLVFKDEHIPTDLTSHGPIVHRPYPGTTDD